MTSNPLDIQEGGDHYKSLKIQPVEYNQANQIPYCEGNAIKYLTRHRNKGKELDLKKAIHNCQLALQMEYGIGSNITYEKVVSEYPQFNFKSLDIASAVPEKEVDPKPTIFYPLFSDLMTFKEDYSQYLDTLTKEYNLDFRYVLYDSTKHLKTNSLEGNKNKPYAAVMLNTSEQELIFYNVLKVLMEKLDDFEASKRKEQL